ncbi:MAG: WYL domain-containing protein [Anaeromyxobacter sp.]
MVPRARRRGRTGRGERLLDLVERLRAVEVTTVERLAADLGVGERTLRRDLAALRRRGLPIAGEGGPGGGVRLLGERGVTAVHLSLAEVVTLWLAARLSRAASDLPWAGAAESALAKLLASLPRPRARELRALCRRVVVGNPASARTREGASRPPGELLRLFEEAFTAGAGLRFDYVDRNGVASARLVEPHGLLVEPPVWYVLARDVAKGEPRMFRMDRIARPALAREVAFAPDEAVVWAGLHPGVGYRTLLGTGRTAPG